MTETLERRIPQYNKAIGVAIVASGTLVPIGVVGAVPNIRWLQCLILLLLVVTGVVQYVSCLRKLDAVETIFLWPQDVDPTKGH